MQACAHPQLAQLQPRQLPKAPALRQPGPVRPSGPLAWPSVHEHPGAAAQRPPVRAQLRPSVPAALLPHAAHALAPVDAAAQTHAQARLPQQRPQSSALAVRPGIVAPFPAQLFTVRPPFSITVSCVASTAEPFNAPGFAAGQATSSAPPHMDVDHAQRELRTPGGWRKDAVDVASEPEDARWRQVLFAWTCDWMKEELFALFEISSQMCSTKLQPALCHTGTR